MTAPSPIRPGGRPQGRVELLLPEVAGRRLPGARLVQKATRWVLSVFLLLMIVSVTASLVLTVDVTVAARGTLEPMRVWPVRSSAAGRISRLLVTTGDTVRSGALVAQMDTLEIAAMAMQLRAQLDAALLVVAEQEASQPFDARRLGEDLLRAEARVLGARASLRNQLVTHGFTVNNDSVLRSYPQGTHVAVDLAVSEVLDAEAAERTARIAVERAPLASLAVLRARREVSRLEAELLLANEKKRRLAIHAPAAGIILSDDLEGLAGAVLNPGDVVLEIAPLDGWRATLVVAERDVYRVRRGDRVSLEVRALASLDRDRLWGRVSSVAPEPSDVAALGVMTRPGPPPPRGYRVVVPLEMSAGDTLALGALRRGFTVRARIVTRSERMITLVRNYLRERIRRIGS